VAALELRQPAASKDLETDLNLQKKFLESRQFLTGVEHGGTIRIYPSAAIVQNTHPVLAFK